MNATVNVVCYKYKILSNGEHPLMIRVCKNNKKKYKSLGISVHPDHWDFKTNRQKNKCPNRELILKIILEKDVEYQKEILELISLQKEYTASTLISAKTSETTNKTVGDYFEELIEQLTNADRLNYARMFKLTRDSLKRFYGKKLDFHFSDIDVGWLLKYEQWLRDSKCAEVTIATLFRILRRAYNRAIEAKYAPKSSYPFNEYKVSKFDLSTQKRAIPKEVIKKIMAVDKK